MNTPATNITQLIAKLSYCCNAEMADQIAEEFYYMNSKARRDKLLEAVLALAPQKPDLIPYLARVVAILGRHYRTFQNTVVQRLVNTFTYLYHRRDQLNVWPRLSNARFICELTKFGACPRSVPISMLRRCLAQVAHFNVDGVCCVLEACGRCLCRAPGAAPCVETLLATLRRLRAQRLDPGSYPATMVDNALLACCPPPAPAGPRARPRNPERDYPLAQQFVRHLLFHTLTAA